MSPEPRPSHLPVSALRLSPRRVLRVLGLSLAGLAGVLVIGGLAVYLAMRASLPALDGTARVAGLAGPVSIQRDASGVPTIRGGSREDVALATGYLHAQERFFQMDLMRRQAAGELSELVGPAALKMDRGMRRHLFRARARVALTRSDEAGRRALAAYTAGVNAGLASLGARPPEYLLLRATPRPWADEDTLLVLYSMFDALQDSDGATDLRRGMVHDTLPPALAELLTPSGTPLDAALDGGVLAEPPLPGPAAVQRAAARDPRPQPGSPVEGEEDTVAGSNGWALAGSHTASGRGLLANDMHLELAVPNTWYRAAIEWPGPDGTQRVVGVTLPGTMVVVVGSNGHVAWGFTASLADTSDVVLLDERPDLGPDVYLTPWGPRDVHHVTEEIAVKGRPADKLDVELTVWGPVIGRDHHGRRCALQWVAHSSGDLGLMALERARGVTEALDLGAACGAPTLNLMVADRVGHIGWTIAGPLPRRHGWDGRTPASFADGTRRWEGLLPPQEHPRVVDPPGGQLWTANNRVLTGPAHVLIGDGGQDDGARASQIRDDLTPLVQATEEDMLRVQLDDRAVLLSRWRELLLGTLTPEALVDHPMRAEARRLVEVSWDGHASVDSVGYRVVRAFRAHVAAQVLGDLTAPCLAADEDFLATRLPQYEGPVWRLVTERPSHLLSARHTSWDSLLLEAVDDALDDLARVGRRLEDRTWGERNTVRIHHPLSAAVPLLGLLLDMPATPLPGDAKMPRVQAPAFGASERLVVTPGDEEHGFLHMPGGQSGHPLSPYYRSGHEAWERGERTPLLPGAAAHTLTLRP